ncbi:MAG TPA: PQQ-binding-like beta-propeller repeat protein, partial [Planctomycetota bacterium]|nr:PQQ-binding-like beta-propeller repeat protein [Planctomycetota bacterium]
MPRRLLLLVLCLAASTGAQEGEVGQPYWISTPPGAGAALKQAVAALANRDWTAAAHALQEVFDRYPTAFAKSGAVYRGARAWATQILGSAPAQLRTEYERLYGPDADEALRQALATGDRPGLLRVVRSFEGTAAGLAAAIALADDAIRRGQPTEARLVLARIARLHPDAAAEGAVEARLALAAARDHAEGGPPPAGPSEEKAALDDAWPMLGGDASRDRVPSRPSFAPLQYTVGIPTQQRVWDNPPQPDPSYYPVRGLRNDEHEWRARWDSYDPVEPVISRGILVASDGKRVSAYNLYSGAPLWQYKDGDVDNDGRTNLSSIFTPVIAQGVVYASVEVSVPFVQQLLQDVPIIYYIPARRLVALDLETGTVLWRHDDEFLETHAGAEPLKTLSITGAPVVRGDRLYAAAVASEGTFHTHVVAIDRHTGDVVYTLRVSNGQQELNLFGRQLQECMPMPLTEKDGVLYMGTNLGVLCTVDALLGTPIWAAGYDTEPIPSTWYWFEAPRRWPRFANSPPLVSGDLVVVAPTDSPNLLAFDRRKGDRVFAVPQDLFAGDRPIELQILQALDAERVYVSGRNGVAAFWLIRDPKRGAEPGDIAWTTSFSAFEDDTGAGRGFLAEDALWVPTDRAIYRIDPVTGKCKSATEREGRDEKRPVHLACGNGVLVTAGRDVLGARFDGAAVLDEARERARLHPDEAGPLLDAADIHLAVGQVSQAVDLFRRAKALADGRGLAAASRRADQGLHRALLRRAWASLDERAFERAEGEFDAALRAAADDRSRIRARM